jgi:uncharacterized protein
MSTDPVSTTPKTAPKPRTWPRWFLRMFLIYIAIPYVAIFVFMALYQRDFIYQPAKSKRLLAESIAMGGPVDDVEIKTADGLVLHGWHFHADRSPDAATKTLLIYFPGNAGCRRDRVSDCREFAELGFDVILFDYRGYGDNPGSPSEAKLASDAALVWELATRDLGYSPKRIILFGESMGGAMATRLASDLSVSGTPPAALVLNSTFDSLAATVMWHYPIFPFPLILLDQYPSVDRIPQLKCALLQFHGTADDVVAFEEGRRLFDAAPARSADGIEKQFVRIPGGQHNFITMTEMRSAVTDLSSKLGLHDDK